MNKTVKKLFLFLAICVSVSVYMYVDSKGKTGVKFLVCVPGQ